MSPGERQHLVRRAGFIMIFTMVAVAISGYLIVESAPDFSNYALLLRSTELDGNLAELRRALRSQPYTFYTTLGDLCRAQQSTEEEVRARLESLVVKSGGATAHPPHGQNQSERASYLATVPRDPYIAVKQWYDAGTQQGVYWSRSYNMVRDPTFAPAGAREAYVEDPFDLFFVRVRTGRGEIWKIGSLGVPVPSAPILSDSVDDLREPQISADGARLLYIRRRTGSSEIWAASSEDGQLQTKITSGTQQVFDTPRWAPRGDAILYRNPATKQFEVKGLFEKTRAYRFPFGLENVSHPAWSPDGRYLAYIGRVAGENRLGVQDFSLLKDRWERLGQSDSAADQISQNDSSRVIDPSLQRTQLGSIRQKLKALPVTPAWSSGGTELVYVEDNGTKDGALNKISLSAQSEKLLPSVSGQTGAGFIGWLPSPVQGTQSTTTSWMLLGRSKGSGATAGYYRRRIDDGRGAEFPLADAFAAPDAAALTEVTSTAISPAGTRVCFPSSDRQSLYLAHLDGADRGLGRLPVVATVSTGAPFCSAAALPGSGGTLESPAIGPVRSFWSYPPANVSIIDSTQTGRFDPNPWRSFVMANQDYDGDSKFGAQWIRVQPPARGDSFVFDNGESTFLATRTDPQNPGAAQGDNIEPCFSPQGQTWIGREGRAPIASERPVNIFKVPFRGGSATTVRITTGLEPAVSPDDRFLVVAQALGRVTTFPPDRTVFPPDNVDLVLVNTSGSVDPKPKILTPDTPLSQEREPCWSPDGRSIYYQREVQEAPSLATHGSSIFRVSKDGGIQAEVQGMEPGTIPGVTTRIEYYSPAVSPDGTRLAFVGKERLRSSDDSLLPAISGDIISETLYVKDLATGGSPKALLRFAHPSHPQYKGDYTAEGMWSLDSPSWTAMGEELMVLRYRDSSGFGNVKFPKSTIYTWDPNGDGKPYFQADHFDDDSAIDSVTNKKKSDGQQEIVRVLASAPEFLKANRSLPKNYDILLSTRPNAQSGAQLNLGVNPGSLKIRIFHPRFAWGSVVFQRILFGEAQNRSIGVSLGDKWYILSGFVRTSPSAQDVHAGQIMLQVLDKSGLLVDQAKADPPIFQAGATDVGAEQWTRFSQSLNFGSPSNPGPYTLLLMLYSMGTVGSYADFTGLALEKDSTQRFPHRFGLGWSIYTPNSDPDPRLPDGSLFER